MADPRAAAPPPTTASLAALDERAREIFRELVEAYLETGDPIGSRTLSLRSGSKLSPASIRNTLHDLADLGLLDAPHAMAGRRPTQAGLRFFVDSLLELNALGEKDRAAIDAGVRGAGPGDWLNAASELLSGLAGGAGVVLTPKREAPLKHADLVPIAADQALMVLVFEDGTVENRLLSTPAGLAPSTLVEAANFLNRRFRGKTLAEARAEAQDELGRERAALDQAAAALVAKGLAEWSGEEPERGRSLIVRGRANLLQDSDAIADLERVRQLFDELERSEGLVRLLNLAGEAESVRIFIGSENPLFSLSGSSVIVAPYMSAERRVVGALGVIGPTRLNYARVIPVVDYTARVVGKLMEGRAASPMRQDRG